MAHFVEICEVLCHDLARDMKARTIVGLAVTVKIKSHDFRTRDTMDKGFALLKDLPLVFF